MRVFKHTSLNQEITFFIRNWIKLLSEGKFGEACLQLDILDDKEQSIAWDSEVLKEVFLDYCWHERMPIINNPYLMNLENEKIDFYKYSNNTGYAVDYNIPTDDNWGDLTAQFSFKPKIEDLYYVYLNNILVL